ncbi:MAG: hypothetical protein ACTHJW_01305 [Streptosporangiaceae bacterium]
MPARQYGSGLPSLVPGGPAGQATPAQWQLAAGSLFAWAGQHGATPSNLGIRVTYLTSGPITAGSAPDCDYAVPLA